MQLDYQIQQLKKSQNRTNFSSGSEALDTYFQKQVSQDIRRNIANCFVAVSGDEIIGFYTLASTSIPLLDLPEKQAKKLPRYPLVPAAMLGRLAISKNHQRQGIGGELIADAIHRSLKADLACYALLVEAIDEEAETFYKHHQFTPFIGRPRTLFLPLSRIKL